MEGEMKCGIDVYSKNSIMLLFLGYETYYSHIFYLHRISVYPMRRKKKTGYHKEMSKP